MAAQRVVVHRPGHTHRFPSMDAALTFLRVDGGPHMWAMTVLESAPAPSQRGSGRGVPTGTITAAAAPSARLVARSLPAGSGREPLTPAS